MASQHGDSELTGERDILAAGAHGVVEGVVHVGVRIAHEVSRKTCTEIVDSSIVRTSCGHECLIVLRPKPVSQSVGGGRLSHLSIHSPAFELHGCIAEPEHSPGSGGCACVHGFEVLCEHSGSKCSFGCVHDALDGHTGGTDDLGLERDVELADFSVA